MILHILVAYDIIADNRRNRLAKFLTGFIGRVQKSVFEGTIEERRYISMEQGIKKIINREEDTVRIYHLCKKCSVNVSVIGTGVFIEQNDQDVIL